MSEERTNRKLPKGGGRKEIIVAAFLCAIVLLVPMLVIELEYRSFISEYGDIKEGAAGAGLLLAVVFRTVSRTVLRTIIRTSARAGMRASLKGAIKNSARAAARSQGKKIRQLFKIGPEEEGELDMKQIKKKNFKSLLFASVLLYVSWIVVIGFGQPYSNLLDQNDSVVLLEQTSKQNRQLMLANLDLAIAAHESELETQNERVRLSDLKSQLKSERDLSKQAEIQEQMALQAALVAHAVEEERAAKDASGDQTFNPQDALLAHDTQVQVVYRAIRSYSRVQRWDKSVLTSVENAVSNYLDSEVELQQQIWKSNDQRDSAEREFAQLDIQLDATLRTNLNEQDAQRVRSFINDRDNLSFLPIMDWLKTYPPFPAGDLQSEPDEVGKPQMVIKRGATAWSSLVLWLGGVVVVLPLWVMYLSQWLSARRHKQVLRHETGVDGGIIQLYFAGAFSFMPLTSDVIVDCTPKIRSRIALSGIFTTSIVAVILWFCGKVFGSPLFIFSAEAFMLYPMVQCFPLRPLEGGFVWTYDKRIWLVMFVLVMAMFMMLASEGLNNVI